MLVRKITRSMMLVAAACIALMMLATIADVLMNNIFRRPIRGTFEFIEILMACTVFLGLPEIFRTNGNVVVDVLDHFLQPKTIATLDRFANVISLIFMLILGYAMLAPSWDTVLFPETKQETGIPTYVIWVPILLGTLVSIIATIHYLFAARRAAPHGGNYE